MNEILFRGKSFKYGTWTYGGIASSTYDFAGYPRNKIYITDEVVRIKNDINGNDECTDDECIEESEYAVIDEVNSATISMFTGITTKAGERVFDGDIVCAKVCGETCVGKVIFGVYDETHIGFYIQWCGDRKYLRKDIKYWEYVIDVIGNIYENEDIIEKILELPNLKDISQTVS